MDLCDTLYKRQVKGIHSFSKYQIFNFSIFFQNINYFKKQIRKKLENKMKPKQTISVARKNTKQWLYLLLLDVFIGLSIPY